MFHHLVVKQKTTGKSCDTFALSKTLSNAFRDIDDSGPSEKGLKILLPFPLYWYQEQTAITGLVNFASQFSISPQAKLKIFIDFYCYFKAFSRWAEESHLWQIAFQIRDLLTLLPNLTLEIHSYLTNKATIPYQIKGTTWWTNRKT